MWSLESCGPRGSGPPAAGSRRHWWEAGPLGARREPHILETSQQSEINAKDFIPIFNGRSENFRFEINITKTDEI